MQLPDGLGRSIPIEFHLLKGGVKETEAMLGCDQSKELNHPKRFWQSKRRQPSGWQANNSIYGGVNYG